jgi:GGDEF domain-containing protein
MPLSELVIWSAMLGGLLTILAMAAIDGLQQRTPGALRNLLFVLVTGTSCVVMTGLPELLLPALPARLMMVLKAGLGPMAGALALYFLGNWLGGIREDIWVHRLTVWGGGALLGLAMLLALAASQLPAARFGDLLWGVAAVNMVPVALAVVAVVRSAVLGDPLARWMSLAIACLVVMVAGLYAKGLDLAWVGTGTQLLTALASVAFFLVATVLVLLRNRQVRLLKRLMRLEMGAEPATGLPTGGALLTQMEHSFWRTARLHGRCSVICLYLANLYETTASDAQPVDGQILVALAARIRRAAGFRCLVGLYHPRCFVVVMDSERSQKPIADMVASLRALVELPLAVTGEWQVQRSFVPQIGVGVLTIDPRRADPLKVLNQVEHMALLSARSPGSPPARGAVTLPAELR